MKQILILAYRLLVSDKGKYTALLVGTVFSVFLIVQTTSMFAGILTKASATVINVGASIWVMDPSATNTVLSSIPMPDYALDAVRSINGVKYAVPPLLRCGSGQVARRHLSAGYGTRAG
jgi:putative ABC transport system permease protein